MSLKRTLYFKISKNHFLSRSLHLLVKINYIIFHWNERAHFVHYGSDDDGKVYYVIRSRGKTEGLLSSVQFVLRESKWAIDNHYIPVVDFSNKLCQYHVDRTVNGSNNAWEYFFVQPADIKLEDIKNKKNILLSGWSFKRRNLDCTLKHEDIKLQPYIKDIVNEFWNEKFSNKKVVGVFIRGTDYVSLKPKNHSVQPTIAQMKEKITEYMEKYHFDYIYLVTEDYNYYSELNNSFPGQVFAYGNNYIKEYKDNTFISDSYKDDPYERGLEYLIRIVLLSMCEYTICSKASGSKFAKLLREKEPVDEYWFELGVY